MFTQTTREMKGKPIINVQNGVKLATFEDLLISPEELMLKALITSKGNLFNRKVEAIPAGKVKVWGPDAILVSESDVIYPQEELGGFDGWLAVLDDLKGRAVVSLDGKRVGQVNDLLIHSDGQITAIELSQVYLEGSLAETKLIAVEEIRSLGTEVVIVDLMEETPHPAEGDLEPEMQQPEKHEQS